VKRIVRFAIALLALVTFTYLAKTILSIIRIKDQAAKQTKLPRFTYSTMKDFPFSDSNISHFKGRVIFNYFHPDCEHCQYMAQSFRRNAEKLKDTKVIMVTVADKSSISKFLYHQHLNSLQNLIILKDDKLTFPKTFGTSVVPSFFIYEENRLIKKIIGETKFENLISK
jgi:thiol-disulfide isomerase/thioredoxin